MNGLHGLVSTSSNLRTQIRINIGGSEVTHEQGHVGVGKTEHAVAGENTSQTNHVEFTEKKRHRKSTAFVPHGTLVVTQSLCCFDSEGGVKRRFMKHVVERLVVHIVHESHQPVVRPLVIERDHQREEFGHVRGGIKTTLVEDVHGLVFLTLPQQGVQSPPRQSIATFVDACLFQQLQACFQLSGRTRFSVGRSVLPSEGAPCLRK